jgi:hypothetical protein
LTPSETFVHAASCAGAAGADVFATAAVTTAADAQTATAATINPFLI